ncbi:uncharacterized protein LOC119601509 [Lucilia sericata]|uniref:uncharacterized protein LOC119601509 n=1 Tax=Lucilia sericata TaxID=13632 RepID=UPI0018A8405A|nr:uncharacterized protein LOC119601509 [Lucilia sericata]
MKAKVFALTFLFNSCLCTLVASENYENITVIDGTSWNHSTKQVVDGKPIVIHTQLQHYDQPTLKEYQECHENLEKCKNVCQAVESPVACITKCPVCPFLVKEKIVVQGINDTDFTSPAAKPLNTTNIIRLTNQIRNIIENHQGNITYRNENIVHFHQNTSRVGGKFGLGYNNTDPCCIIVRSSKNCETQQFSTAAHCHRKRHRVCGKQCISRVMMAKRVTLCENTLPLEENVDYLEENCREIVKYIPYHSRKKHLIRMRNKCVSIPYWPYVACGHKVGMDNYEHSICRRCQHLTYYYVLQRGVPAQCNRCFMTYPRPPFEMYPPQWYPVMGPHIEDVESEDDFDFHRGGWQKDKTKCRLPNGTISENCNDIEGSGTESSPTTSDPWAELPEAQDEYLEYDTFNNDDLENVRRRRHTFTRSKYSRRYMQ